MTDTAVRPGFCVEFTPLNYMNGLHPGPAIRCDDCGRFTSRKNLHASHESGDYGTIYSTSFHCNREDCPR